MLTKKIKELEATRARANALEKSIAAQLGKQLAALPREYGFESVEDFVSAVRAAGGSRRGRGRVRVNAEANGAKRRRRATITDATRAQVKAMVEDGKTGAAIAKTLKISLPSVQNIKKALGLVKGRK